MEKIELEDGDILTIHFQHYRQEDPTGREALEYLADIADVNPRLFQAATTCLIVQTRNGTTLGTGFDWALCSRKDAFVKRIGRRLSFQRALDIISDLKGNCPLSMRTEVWAKFREHHKKDFLHGKS